MNVEDFWYVVALSRELSSGQVLARKLFGEWLAVFRDGDGAARVLQDRCRHRHARLSDGAVEKGCLRCPYHGWLYDGEGTVVEVPSEGEGFVKAASRKTPSFPVLERDGFVYTTFAADPEAIPPPFTIPGRGEPGFRSMVLINDFENNVTNCAENFIDIPHTVYVHPGIFRTTRRQKLDATVRREAGEVHCEYRGEDTNLGWFARFLNPDGGGIQHTDSFFMPNVTSVEYIFGPRRRLRITSHTVPEEAERSRVYTDLTWDFGVWSGIARPILWWQAQKVIDQDVEALARQMAVIRKYGRDFNNTKADAIHVLVESIIAELEAGRDPRELPVKSVDFTFYV